MVRVSRAHQKTKLLRAFIKYVTGDIECALSFHYAFIHVVLSNHA